MRRVALFLYFMGLGGCVWCDTIKLQSEDTGSHIGMTGCPLHFRGISFATVIKGLTF